MKIRFSILILAILFSTHISCEKETITPDPIPVVVCDVKGTFTGTGTALTGAMTTMTYRLQDNNLALGSVTPAGAITTVGGYSNTCDSVILSVYYNGNNSYFLLSGKLNAAKTNISATFKNLTIPSDYGTFTMSK